MEVDQSMALSLLWAQRATVQVGLGCAVTIQRLFVLLLALTRGRIGPDDVQAAAQEHDHGPHEALERLACIKLAYGQLYRLHLAGVLVRSDKPGCYTLAPRARVTLERALALERQPVGELGALEDPEISYSVRVAELDVPLGERDPVRAFPAC